MSQVDSEVHVDEEIGGGAVELDVIVVADTAVVAGATVVVGAGATVVGTTVVVGATVVGTAVGFVPIRFAPLPHAETTTMNTSRVVKPVFIVEPFASREASMVNCPAVVSSPSHAALRRRALSRCLLRTRHAT
ncbi:MAG: hypothetical protein QF844_08955 [Acidimicrobiales bacterium]|nr:hypothetical protein [Acidimicrobiales bacterium]